jgi:hypothetical protein
MWRLSAVAATGLLAALFSLLQVSAQSITAPDVYISAVAYYNTTVEFPHVEGPNGDLLTPSLGASCSLLKYG